MSTSQSLANPSSKTLCGTPKGLGPVEIVIEFQVSNETPIGPSGEESDSHSARPTDGTKVWYHTLGETEKQIKGLQFHETVNHPPFVTLYMNDGSLLLFEISSSDPKSVCVTRLTISDARNLAPPSIQVDFSPAPPNGDRVRGEYVDLKFAIAVCYGVGNCAPVAYGPAVHQRLFALALFVSIVRQGLPIGHSLIQDIVTIPEVDKLWVEGLSRELAGQLLWENEIVEKVYRVANQGIHAAATEQLGCFVPSAAAPLNLANSTAMVDNKHFIAKLTTAWLESTALKGRTSALDLWDLEWERTWGSEWEKNWEKNWSAELFRINYIDLNRFAPEVPATSVLSGSAAGRAMIGVALVANAIPKRPELSISTGAAIDHTQSKLVNSGEEPTTLTPLAIPVKEIDEARAVGTHPEKGQTTTRIDECSWIKFWYSIQRPDVKHKGKWLPAWEAACNMAWALAWGDYLQERATGPETTFQRSEGGYVESPIEEIRSRSPPNVRDRMGTRSTSKKSSLISAYTPDYQFWGLRAIRDLLNRPQDDMMKISRHTPKPDLQMLSAAAWKEACESDPSMNQYIEQQANISLALLNNDMERIPGVTAPDGATRIQEVFKKTLAKTWRTCWERAWGRVMNDTLAELDELKGTAERITNNTPLAFDVRRLKSYTALENYMRSGTSQEENHWRIRSAFKASNLLHSALEHSIPVCYEGTMRITQFTDRPFQFSTPNPGPKLKGIAKVIQQDRKEQITHSELQEKIRNLTRASRTPKFPDGYNAMDKMQQIWNTANSIDDNFMNSKDTTQPRPPRVQVNKPPERKNTILFPRARYLLMKAVRDLSAPKHRTLSQNTQAATLKAPQGQEQG